MQIAADDSILNVGWWLKYFLYVSTGINIKMKDILQNINK